MKKKIFMACAALVVSAAAVVGVKASSSSTYSLLDANLEAIANGEANSEGGYVHCVSKRTRPNGAYPDLDLMYEVLSVCDNRTKAYDYYNKPNVTQNSTTQVYDCLLQFEYAYSWDYFGLCY